MATDTSCLCFEMKNQMSITKFSLTISFTD